MPGKDPDHWLYRLTAEEWLRAAENELARARAALRTKQQRAGVATARRAAGMALNAVLSVAPPGSVDAYGRSYMEHLQALAADASLPPDLRDAATALLKAPLQAELVQLGPGDTHLADAAASILEHARSRL